MPKEIPRPYGEVAEEKLDSLSLPQRRLFELIVEGITERGQTPSSKTLAKQMSDELGIGFSRAKINKIRQSMAEELEILAGF